MNTIKRYMTINESTQFVPHQNKHTKKWMIEIIGDPVISANDVVASEMFVHLSSDIDDNNTVTIEGNKHYLRFEFVEYNNDGKVSDSDSIENLMNKCLTVTNFFDFRKYDDDAYTSTPFKIDIRKNISLIDQKSNIDNKNNSNSNLSNIGLKRINLNSVSRYCSSH